MGRARHWLIIGFIVAIALAITATGCTSPATSGASTAGETNSSPSEVRFVVTEWKYEPATIQAPSGRPVTLIMENKGVIEHDFHVPALDLTLVAKPGETVKQTVTFDKPGTYDYECSLPGHKAAGMAGKFIVGDGQPSASTSPATAGTPATAHATHAPVPANLTHLPKPQVAPPINRTTPTVVPVEIEVKEVTAILDDGVAYTYWTFGGTVPGPMIRVMQGDTVELTLKNAPESKVTHSIDLHAVTGPGGGAKVTQVPPGGQATFRFKALNPGVYVYHCATPMVAHHIANGMYGLIVVEPPGGLPPVDREYYVMQGDFYLQGERGDKGLREFAMERMLDENPDYVLFNGAVGSLMNDGALRARVGETVRIFFGVGGPNLTSSFHVIGEIFDRVYPEGASEPLRNVQTTLVPAGGATIVEFKLEVPGTYVLVDHSLGRLEKGGAAHLVVEGDPNPEVFEAVVPGQAADAGH